MFAPIGRKIGFSAPQRQTTKCIKEIDKIIIRILFLKIAFLTNYERDKKKLRKENKTKNLSENLDIKKDLGRRIYGKNIKCVQKR